MSYIWTRYELQHSFLKRQNKILYLRQPLLDLLPSIARNILGKESEKQQGAGLKVASTESEKTAKTHC